MKNEAKSAGFFELTERDFNEIQDKFHTLEHLLTKEGLLP